MSNVKVFDRKLYEKYDGVAKTTAMNFLVSKGFREVIPVDKQKELYKAGDMVLWDPVVSKMVMIECEVKRVWTKIGEWQGYPDIDVPYRKHKSKSDYYIMFNETLDTLALTNMATILASPVVKKNTRYTRDEEFFRIPINNFNFYTLSDDVWTLL